MEYVKIKISEYNRLKSLADAAVELRTENTALRQTVEEARKAMLKNVLKDFCYGLSAYSDADDMLRYMYAGNLVAVLEQGFTLSEVKGIINDLIKEGKEGKEDHE